MQQRSFFPIILNLNRTENIFFMLKASLNVRFHSLFFFLLITPVSPLLSANILIHTDNIVDLAALQSNNGLNNFSVSTNLYALKKEYTNVHFEYMTFKRSIQFMEEDKSICIVNKSASPAIIFPENL